MELKLLYSCQRAVAYLKTLSWPRLSVHAAICLTSLLVFMSLSYNLYQIIPRDNHFDHDSFFYDSSARAMHAHDQHTQKHLQTPIQTVAYPFMISLLYRLMGNSLGILIMFQGLIALLSLLLIYRIAYLLWGTNIALCSLVLSCVNLGFITYTHLVLAEILLTFLLLLFLERLLASITTQSYTHVMQAAIALGLSLLVKPIALLLPLFLLCMTLVQKQRRYCIRAFVLCLVSYGLVGVYMTRNYMVYNSFSLAPMMSLNMYQCFLSKVIGRLEQRSSYEVAQTTLAFKGDDIFDESGWRDARSLFYTTLTKHPGICAIVWCENVTKTLFGLFGTQFKQLVSGRNDPEHPHSFFLLAGTMHQRLYAYVIGGCPPAYPWVKWICIVEVLASIARWVLVAIASVVLMRRKEYWVCIGVSVGVGLLAGMTGMDGCCRYRMTFEPILIILTAYGIWYIYEQWVQDRASRVKFYTKRAFSGNQRLLS